MSPESEAATVASAAIPAQEIARFVVERFLPGVAAEELEAEYDLLTTGVIDSLGVLHVVAWLRREHGVQLAESAVNIRNFRSVAAIQRTAADASAGDPA